MIGVTAAPPDGAPVPLLEPREGVPPVVATPDALAAVAAAFAAGTGPVAVDAERASGYRYGQRAYLLQFRREGAGTALVDPIAVPDLAPLRAAIADAEWVLHAASQDLPCLADLGLHPRRLFDTELAGRLLGRPRVGLGPLVEAELGLVLEKGHAAVDWSTRPLPEPWLRYAALDVEVLVDLRNVLAADLARTGKADWAEQEFAALVAAPPAPPRAEPWRRTSGLHRVRQRRALAVVRALWEARDDVARRRDLSPGRVLPDAAIVAAALALPRSPDALLAVPGYDGRGQRRRLDTWWGAVADALALPDDALPLPAAPSDGPPPPRSWADRDPAAAARLRHARAALGALADELALPVENLLAPDTVRRLAWSPPGGRPDPSASAIAAAAAGYGARDWQVQLTADRIAAAFADAHAGRPVPAAPDELAGRAAPAPDAGRGAGARADVV